MPFESLTLVGTRNHVLDGVEILQRQVAIFGVVRPSEKHRESLLRCMHHSILNNDMTCDAAFCQNSSTTCYYYYYYHRVLLFL